jgi:hypothetical protein
MVATPVIPTLRRLRQENCKFESSLSFISEPYLKNKQAMHGWLMPVIPAATSLSADSGEPLIFFNP